MEVGRKAGTPREGDSGVAAILEIPRGQIARSLQFVLRSGKSDIDIQGDAEPLVAKAERSRRGEIVGMRDIAF